MIGAFGHDVRMARAPLLRRRIVSWGLALAALSFVAWVVPFRDHGGEPGLYRIVTHANLGILGALLLVYLAGTGVWAARWRRLLRLAGIQRSLFWVWRLTVQAQAAGVLLPGGLGGDAMRIAWVTGEGARLPIALGSVLLDRAIGLTTLATLGALGGISAGSASPALWVLGAIPVGFVLGVVLLRSALVREAAWMSRGFAARTLKPVVDYLAEPEAPSAIVTCALLSFVLSAIQLGVNRGLIVALGAHPISEKWVYVGLTLAMTTGAIPALPGGWGTVDAAYVYFLGLAGLSAPIALAVCLLYRLFWYLSGAVGSVLLMAQGTRPLVTPPRT